MSNYDSPGFTDRYPGGDGPHGTGAPGSSPGPYPATDSIPDSLSSGTTADSAVVTPAGASLVNADRVNVGPNDTLVGAQKLAYGPSIDPLNGNGIEQGVTGAGMGSNVMQSHHPGSTARPA
jgi:hypothetical protein